MHFEIYLTDHELLVFAKYILKYRGSKFYRVTHVRITRQTDK